MSVGPEIDDTDILNFLSAKSSIYRLAKKDTANIVLTVFNTHKGVLSKLFNTDVASEALEVNAGLMCDDGNIDGAIQV